METATVSQLKTELKYLSEDDLVKMCLRLARFKKENKELLSYLLFESNDKQGFTQSSCREISELFEEINTSSYYFIKKSVRKILRLAKKYIRYAQDKEIEVQLLMHFCKELQQMTPSFRRNQVLLNLFNQQIKALNKTIDGLHEDLQFDYRVQVEELSNQDYS